MTFTSDERRAHVPHVVGQGCKQRHVRTSPQVRRVRGGGSSCGSTALLPALRREGLSVVEVGCFEDVKVVGE